MKTSQKLKITTPANENQADFGRKDTKIKSKNPTRQVYWLIGEWLNGSKAIQAPCF